MSVVIQNHIYQYLSRDIIQFCLPFSAGQSLRFYYARALLCFNGSDFLLNYAIKKCW